MLCFALEFAFCYCSSVVIDFSVGKILKVATKKYNVSVIIFICNVNEFQLLRTALEGSFLKVLLIGLSNRGNDLPVNNQ